MKTSQAFIDGSFNTKTKVYGWGVLFIDHLGQKYILQGSGNEPDMVALRNVAGEITAATEAIKHAQKLNQDILVLHYDYEGIAKWATGLWKAKKPATKAYMKFCKSVAPMKLLFVHTKAHTGIPGNEIADILAKNACGLIDLALKTKKALAA